jgi:hypothetical protein
MASGILSEPWLRRSLGERGDPQSSNHVQERRRTTATAEARLHGLAHEHRHQDEGDGAVAWTGAAQHALFTNMPSYCKT